MLSTIIKAVNRAMLRGKRLDDDCRRAIISKYEYGPSDNRCFCYGLYENYSVYEIKNKCIKCGAYFMNAKPPKKERSKKMKITKTTTKTYDVYDCAKWRMSIGDTIISREKVGMKTRDFDKCFICKKKFEYNDFPYLALIRGHKNSFICEDCAKKVNQERVGD